MASNETEILDPAAAVGTLKKIAAGRKLNRRNFVAALGMTGAAAGAELMSGCSTSTSPTGTTAGVGAGQINALNFALNFAYLEATFYSFITQGADLSTTLTANTGAVTNAPAKLTFSGFSASGLSAAQVTDMLNEIYFDEKNHVSTLLSILGSAAVPRPAINLAAFGTIVAGAPGSNQANAISFARAMEDLGVSAYAGLVTSVASSSLTFLGQLLGDESFHAGALRLVSIQNPTIAPYGKIDSLDVQPTDLGSASVNGPTSNPNTGFFTTAGSANSSSTTPAGFAFARTTSQVLAISYGGSAGLAASGATSGGLFPNGVNGPINTV